MTRPAPPAGVEGEVVEMDALNLEEWEGAQHTPEVNDAKLEALVKQTVAAPPDLASATKSRTKTQAMPHVVVRPSAPSAPSGANKPLPIPTEVPIAVPIKRTATPPVGVPAPPVAKKRGTPAAGLPAPPVAKKAPAPPGSAAVAAKPRPESAKVATVIDQEESEGWALPRGVEDDWTEVGTTVSISQTVRAAAAAAPAPAAQAAVPQESQADQQVTKPHPAASMQSARPATPATPVQTQPLPQTLRPVAQPQRQSKPQPKPRAESEPPAEKAIAQPLPPQRQAQTAPQPEPQPERQAQPAPQPQLLTQPPRPAAQPALEPAPPPPHVTLSLPLPAPPVSSGSEPPRQPNARMPSGPAPSDEAIPVLRDERHEVTDAHRLRFKRRAVIVALAVVALIVVVVLVARRGPAKPTTSRPPAPGATATAPSAGVARSIASADTSPTQPPAEPPPADPPAIADPPAATPPARTHTGHTASTGRTRGKPTAGTTHSNPGTTDPGSADDGDKHERARAAYSTGNDKLFAGDTAGAIRAYRESTRLGYAAGYRGLGLAYAQAGDRALARAALANYLARSPNAKDAALIKKRIAALK